MYGQLPRSNQSVSWKLLTDSAVLRTRFLVEGRQTSLRQRSPGYGLLVQTENQHCFFPALGNPALVLRGSFFPADALLNHLMYF